MKKCLGEELETLESRETHDFKPDFSIIVNTMKTILLLLVMDKNNIVNQRVN